MDFHSGESLKEWPGGFICGAALPGYLLISAPYLFFFPFGVDQLNKLLGHSDKDVNQVINGHAIGTISVNLRRRTGAAATVLA